MAALDGMRILDLTQYEAGTSCTQALAWLGADVVKIERPGTGDPGRGAFDEYGFEDSEYFINWNSNKRSVTIALDQPEGRELIPPIMKSGKADAVWVSTRRRCKPSTRPSFMIPISPTRSTGWATPT